MRFRTRAFARAGVALGICLLAAAVIAALNRLPILPALTALGAELRSHGALGMAVFAAIFVAGAMAFVPSGPFSLAAGLIYGPWGIALAWLSMMMAASISLPLSRRLLAGPVREFVRDRRLLRTISEVIDREGWRMVLLIRVSGLVPFGLQNYALGVTRIGVVPYLGATSLGVLPSILVYAGAGAFGSAAIEDGRADPLRIALLSGAVIAGLAAVVLTGRKVRARLAAAG